MAVAGPGTRMRMRLIQGLLDAILVIITAPIRAIQALLGRSRRR